MHQILVNDFSMQMSPKTVNYGGKDLGFGNGRFLQKNLGFGVGFGYRNNTTLITHVIIGIIKFFLPKMHNLAFAGIKRHLPLVCLLNQSIKVLLQTHNILF